MTERELLSEMDKIEDDNEDGWSAWIELKDLLVSKLSPAEREDYESRL